MTKSELKEVIKECLYESGVIEEPVNEGFFEKCPHDSDLAKSIGSCKKMIKTKYGTVLFMESCDNYKEEIANHELSFKEIINNIDKTLSKDSEIGKYWKVSKGPREYYHEYYKEDSGYSYVIFKSGGHKILVSFENEGTKIKSYQHF